MRSSFPWFVVAVLCSTAGCGGEPSAPSPEIVSVAREPVVGGYVDSATTGVVGLAISGTHVFQGHCSGTLIAPNLVLTARHCVSLTAGTPQEHVQCGVSQFVTTGSGSMFLASPDTVRPLTGSAPTFFPGVSVRVPDGATDFCGFDVALITLAGKGIPAELATPIEPRLDSAPSPRETFSAEGFGLTDPNTNDTDGTRMRLDDRTVACSGAGCQSPDQIQGDEWLSLDSAICPGDSGGPALDAQGRVMGVASRGADGCANAIYGDVHSWRDLIVETARDAAERGGYDVPAWAADPDGGAAASTPLGQACEKSCADDFVCYAETGKPPGICVPRCVPAVGDCPTGYACSSSLSACVPDTPPSSSHSGCAVSSARRGSGEPTFLLAAIAAGLFLAARARRTR